MHAASVTIASMQLAGSGRKVIGMAEHSTDFGDCQFHAKGLGILCGKISNGHKMIRQSLPVSFV